MNLEIIILSEVTKRKTMAPHSSTLAWKIPWTEEPGRLQSMGSLRVRHNWATSLSLFTFMHWRRKWQPTPVFLPGESQGWGSLVGCRLWGHTESDTTEVTYLITYVWNLKCDTNEAIHETESQTERIDWWFPREEGVGGGIEWEVGVSWWKLLGIKWINMFYCI